MIVVKLRRIKDAALSWTTLGVQGSGCLPAGSNLFYSQQNGKPHQAWAWGGKCYCVFLPDGATASQEPRNEELGWGERERGFSLEYFEEDWQWLQREFRAGVAARERLSWDVGIGRLKLDGPKAGFAGASVAKDFCEKAATDCGSQGLK